MRTVCLVACVGTKLQKPAPARELYVSDLFEKSRAYAEACFDQWYILSAKHGLLHPEQIIEPYECTLNNMPKVSRQQWSERVFAQINSSIKKDSFLGFVAGERYREGLVTRLDTQGYEVRIPLEGLSIGLQLSWLKKITAESERLRHLDRYYGLLNELQKGLGGKRTLKKCTGALNWPEMGVYFFFEPNEFRATNIAQKGSSGWNALREQRIQINALASLENASGRR